MCIVQCYRIKLILKVLRKATTDNYSRVIIQSYTFQRLYIECETIEHIFVLYIKSIFVPC